MIPLIKQEGDFYRITLHLDLNGNGNRSKSYWARTKEEIPAIVERHVFNVEKLARYFS